MKTISLEDFMKLVEADEALAAQVRADSDPETAMKTVLRLAAEAGYELKAAVPAEKVGLEDDDLSVVTGGLNPFVPQGSGELNPYSWFVTLLRRLMGKDEDETLQSGRNDSRMPEEAVRR